MYEYNTYFSADCSKMLTIIITITNYSEIKNIVELKKIDHRNIKTDNTLLLKPL